MPSPSHLVAAFALLALPAAPLLGQDDLDAGNWVGVGLAAGSASMECVGCQEGRETSIAGHLRFGTTVSRRAQLGVELSLWKRWESDFDEDIRIVSANLRVAPRVLRGFWAQAGFGYADYEATHEEEGGFEAHVQTRGWTALGGVGYAFRFRRGFSLDPFLSYARQFSGELALSGVTSGEQARVELIQLGLGITWFRGR